MPSPLEKELTALLATANADAASVAGLARTKTAEALVDALRALKSLDLAAMKKAGAGHWLPAILDPKSGRKLPPVSHYPQAARAALTAGRALGGTDADVVVAFKGAVFHAHPEGFWTLGKTPLELAKHFNRHVAANRKHAAAEQDRPRLAAEAAALDLSPQLHAYLQKTKPAATRLELTYVNRWPDLAKYKKVKYLSARGPTLTAVGDLSLHPQLGELLLSHLAITSLPKLPALTTLTLVALSKLKDTSALAACATLVRLDLNTCAPTSLDLRAAAGLELLYVSETPLTNVQLGTSRLTRASFRKTKLTDLGFLSGQSKLVDLDLTDTPLTALPASLAALPLRRLVLKGTRLKTLPPWLRPETKVER